MVNGESVDERYVVGTHIADLVDECAGDAWMLSVLDVSVSGPGKKPGNRCRPPRLSSGLTTASGPTASSAAHRSRNQVVGAPGMP